MKILFLSRWFPYPADNGAKLRIYHLLRGLAQVHEVHLISFADDPQSARIDALRTFCQDVRVIAWKEFQPNSIRALAGFLGPVPRSLADIYSSRMEEEIRQVLGKESFHLAILSQWQMMAYQHLFRGIPLLLEEIEMGVPYEAYFNATNRLSRIRNGLTWLKHRAYLKNVLKNNITCTVVSEHERCLLAELAPHCSSIHVIPNGVSLADYAGIQGTREPGSLIFTGSFKYPPNYQAILWFLDQVYPRIQEKVPGVKLTITGDPNGLSLPQRQGVHQTGYVTDVRPLIARACVSVVPLQVGGGTRLKILEAMAINTPVVSTSKGAEGLDVRAGEHLLIADTAEAFARQVVELLSSAQLREHLAAEARRLVQNHYDWQVILPEFLELVQQASSAGYKYLCN